MATPLVYPPSLPCPQRASFQRREARALSNLPGLRRSRTLYRDRGGSEPVQFLLTFEQTLIWRDWFEIDQLQGGAWFSADWRLPSGRSGVYRFVGTPSYPEFVPVVGWRVSAELEVRGRGMAPRRYSGSVVVADVDVNAVTNAGTTSAVGIVVGGLDPSKVYTLTMPPGRAYSGWRGAPPQPWVNQFRITTSAGTTIYGSGTYATAELARAAFPGATVTGYSSYTFWIFDDPTIDNSPLEGVSIRMTTEI